MLLHATSFCADVWRPVWAAARARGARERAVAVDQRGHGGSETPARAEEYAWPRLAEDLVALAHAAGARRGDDPRSRGRAAGERRAEDGVALVGHSSGGAAALSAAGLAPERVRAVAVIEPVLFAPRGGADADSFAGSRGLAASARRRRAVFESRDEARKLLGRRFPYSGFAREAFEAWLEGGLAEQPDGSVALRCTPQVESWAYEGAAALDLWPLVERIAAPVLILVAEHSAIPAPLLDRLRRALPDARVQQIASTTHFAALEQPDAVGAALAPFLERARR